MPPALHRGASMSRPTRSDHVRQVPTGCLPRAPPQPTRAGSQMLPCSCSARLWPVSGSSVRKAPAGRALRVGAGHSEGGRRGDPQDAGSGPALVACMGRMNAPSFTRAPTLGVVLVREALEHGIVRDALSRSLHDEVDPRQADRGHGMRVLGQVPALPGAGPLTIRNCRRARSRRPRRRAAPHRAESSRPRRSNPARSRTPRAPRAVMTTGSGRRP